MPDWFIYCAYDAIEFLVLAGIPFAVLTYYAVVVYNSEKNF